MSTVLVTGGGGYIGSVLVGMLLDAGHSVRVVDRFFFGRELIADLEKNDQLTVIKDDIRTVGASAFEGVDVVAHLAGISNDPACDLDPRISEEVNMAGTMNVANRAKEAGVKRFIFDSSCSIYGAGKEKIVNETSPMAPVSLYARTKIDAEAELAKMNDDSFAVITLRNATAYGLSPRMRFDLVINIMTLFAYQNRKIHVLGGGKQWRPLVHVRDISRAHLAVMEAPLDIVQGEAFNVGDNDQNYQIYGIAQMVRDVVPNTALEMVPDDPDKRSYHVSFDKINEKLGFKVSTSPYEGIVEIKQALERGVVDDSVRTRTVHYYTYLLDAERIMREVALQGAIF
ncbi:MAG: NAD-dependent epimerase/dehydratase family protein [Acidimicrobiales bacterium]